jgi:iron-sulfur cluster repair protein YtfE (RIC family)
MSQSILNTLRDDHRHIEGILIQIQACNEIVEKKSLYLQLEEELFPHMAGEEKSIYVHLMKDVHDEEAEEVAQRSINEHKAIKNLLAKLDNMGIESDEWDSTFRKLSETVKKHIKDEERVLFTEAKVDFSVEELVEFGDEFNEVKQLMSL